MESKEYEQPSSRKFNQGIRDNRPEGEGPPQAKVLGDTVIDTDASAESGVLDTSAFPGPPSSATSQDVHQGLGHPGSGMTSAEVRHDRKQTHKKEGYGAAQWGAPKERNIELDRAQRVTRDDVGPTSGV